MQLESKQEAFRAQGVGLAAIVHAPPSLVADFARKHGVTYPVLADPDSKIIRSFGLINPAYGQGDVMFGAPYAGTLKVDKGGVVQARYFEPLNAIRRTAGSMLVLSGGEAAGSSEIRTEQFALRASTSDSEAFPGNRITLVLDFEVARDHHVYAPGTKGYRALALLLESSPLLDVGPTRFPPSRAYYFAPLKETVPVFEGRFQVLQDVTLAPVFPDLDSAREIAIEGSIQYQVCSHEVCYPPSDLRLRWTVTVRPTL